MCEKEIARIDCCLLSNKADDNVIIELLGNENILVYGMIAINHTERWSFLYKQDYDFVIEIAYISKGIKTYTFIGSDSIKEGPIKTAKEVKDCINCLYK